MGSGAIIEERKRTKRQTMKLSKRLEMIASFVKPGSRLADIGTDHGYIPIALTERGVIPSALAMDVRKGPLERAREHIGEAGLAEQIETRLSNGLEKLKAGEADTVVIAGMGGELEIHILEEGRHIWDSAAQWVLSPQSDLEHVRRYLLEHGFSIDREAMVKEDGKFYTIMDVAGPGRRDAADCSGWRESDYVYGKYLIETADPILKEFLEQEKKTVSGIFNSLNSRDTDSSKKRAGELKKKLDLIEEAQYEMQGNN